MKERTRERSAACATCGKTFARSDTLLRHEKNHHNTEDRGPVHRVTNGTFRACNNCAQARSRCSGGEPCGRCKVRSITCVYPAKRRKTEDDPVTYDTFAQTSHAGPQGQDGSISSRQYGDTINGFVTSSDDGFSQPPLTSSQPFVGSNTRLTTIPYGNRRPSAAADVPNQQTPHEQHLQLDQATAMPPNAQPQLHDVSQYTDPILSTTYPADFSVQTSYPYESSYEDPLNWIPLSYYPSPFGDMEQDLSFLLPTLSDAASGAHDFATTAFAETNLSNLDATSFPQTDFVADPVPLPNKLPQSPTSSTSDSLGPFRLTAGSATSADLKKRKRKSSFAADIFLRPRHNKDKFVFPEVSETAISVIARRYCSEEKYSSILKAFRDLCHGGPSPAFSTTSFPSAASLNACIELYFDHFHYDFPILHRPTLGEGTHWLVLLAAAAVGCTFAKLSEICSLRDAFQEFLRRACRYVEENEGDCTLNINLAQARILNLISLSQSEKDVLRRQVPKYHAEHSRWCLEAGLLQANTQDFSSLPSEGKASGEESSWHNWIHEETLRRLAYFSWLLDTSFGYLCDARPLQNMDDARAPMPCHMNLWEAGSSHQWAELLPSTPKMPSLCDALEEMYSKKSVDATMSETAHILLIYALISRTWEVGTHIKQPLSEWKSTGNATGFLNTPVKDNFWLPLYPLYANWRNSACDCLDVLNWHASSLAAQASGEEHNTILHLHLARVILLTPFQELQDLVFFILDYKVWPNAPASFYVHDGSYQIRDKAKAGQIKKITWRWLREDQHKARLAIIHAGSVFWHIRRYSNNTFFEPTAIYLASIVLWVYGSFKSAALAREAATTVQDSGEKKPNQGPADSIANVQPTRVERAGKVYESRRSPRTASSGQAQPDDLSFNSPLKTSPSSEPQASTGDDEAGRGIAGDESDTESSPDQPEFIYLDRPNDDEMVQHFVRGGHNFTSVSMTNVGDICQNPTKVLYEGAKLLKTRLASWGISREYHDILVRLSEMRKTSTGIVVPISTPAYTAPAPVQKSGAAETQA